MKMRCLATLLVIADLHSRIYGFVSFAAAGVSRISMKSNALSLSPVEDISLGAPYSRPLNGAYISAGGVKVDVEVEDVLDSAQAISDMVDMIDNHKGKLKRFLRSSCRWRRTQVNQTSTTLTKNDPSKIP